MCGVLIDIFKEIYKLDYLSSEKGLHFEGRIEAIIKRNINKYRCQGLCVVQPNGGQNWPDFQLEGWNHNGIAININIECKRSKGDIIMWNEGIPRPDIYNIYIYNGKKETKNNKISGTTFVLGSDLISQENYQKIEESFKTPLKEFTTNQAHLFNSTEWTPNYARAQYKAPSDKKYYLTNPERSRRETNVFNMLSSLTIQATQKERKQ